MTVGELKDALSKFQASLPVKIRAEYSTQATWELVETDPDTCLLVRCGDGETFVAIEKRLK